MYVDIYIRTGVFLLPVLVQMNVSSVFHAGVGSDIILVAMLQLDIE